MNHDQHLATIIAELPYWPSISYLANLTNAKLLLLENCEHFVKSSNRNRCWIAGPNGALLLTIPISGGRSHKQLYREVVAENTKSWRRQHWQSIKSAYGKSPFFEYYEDELATMYYDQENQLWAINLHLLKWLLQKLRLHVEIQQTKDFLHQYEQDDCRLYAAWKRLDLPAYYQCFSEKNGFLSDLAGIDLLFNLGPEAARAYLTRIAKQSV